MARLRRALGSIAAAWILCQTMTVGIAPAVAWLGSADAAHATCIPCTYGVDAMCPMHQHATPAGSRPCVMRGTHGSAVFASVLGLLGFLPEKAPEATLASTARTIPLNNALRVERPAPPDPPPPRA